MTRINNTAILTCILIFIALIFLLRLRNRYVSEDAGDSEGYNGIPINDDLAPPRPPILYTVEKFGEEGSQRSYAIQTEMHADQYCIGYKFLEATETFREADNLEPVTLATHATSDMIDAIENMSSLWDGPISIGIFVDYHSSNVLEYLAELYRCDIRFRRKMTVHFAFRRSPFQTTCPLFELPQSNRTCPEFFASHDILRSAIVGPFQLYPSNLMRNIARKGALSDIQFIMDGDMIPSEGFAIKIKPIANEVIDGKSKKVLAIRRFETKTGNEIPRDHRKLLKSKKAHETFEFHHRFFSQGHHIENLDDWFRTSIHTEIISTSEVAYPGYLWEVQTILHRNDPYNADYFPSRIKVMHSLIYALCRAGYTFHVPTHVFDVHEGIKHTNTIYSKATIAHQEAYAMKIAGDRYIQEMNELYPDTLQKCGEFSMI
ncbi:hypothetical protein CAEBREN_23507 [Caenorhabditis brenneri]|uniref:Uncharacterized protein n=1 Tax=Caenorhabditis brenneri TaxID=135651 RepID=G0NTJ3_CAEBE|nr:hypothetical protein CAEBREN_23507 [Caenorhabditis brenneri]